MQKLKNKKVLVAMSGGVDSSVAAYLLLKEGYEVAGATMKLYSSSKSTSDKIFSDKTTSHSASLSSAIGSDESIRDAKAVCKKLNIKHYVFDYTRELEENVIKDFIDSYLSGRTPNPCIKCNRIIKFGLLIKKAQDMGFDYFATGHYASIIVKDKKYYIGKGADSVKDQSYFLYRIKKENLPFIKFPLSSYKKSEIKNISKEAGLALEEKKESQEICFIKDKSYHDFIKERVETDFSRHGNIRDTKGNIIGRHKGLAFYTIGQRKGFGISHEKPLYVTEIDVKKNEITVGERPYLFKKGLIADSLNWFTDEVPGEALAKIRFNHKETECRIFQKPLCADENKQDLKDEKNGITGFKEPDNYKKNIYVKFLIPQEAVTPGQSVVFYDKKAPGTVLGGGIITEGTDY